MSTTKMRVCIFCRARNNDEATIFDHAQIHGEHPETQAEGVTVEQAITQFTVAESDNTLSTDDRDV